MNSLQNKRVKKESNTVQIRENRSRRQHGIASREDVSLDNMNNTNPTKTG